MPDIMWLYLILTLTLSDVYQLALYVYEATLKLSGFIHII